MNTLIVHCGNNSIQAALFEGQQLAEYFMEHAAKRQLVGNVYKGRVVNVLPGMQAAFVDIGLERNAFLYVDDLLPSHLELQPSVKPSIRDLVAPGDELLVQLVKEPLGTKGAKVTTHFTLPGRWIVYMPGADYVGISRKIEHAGERDRLSDLSERLRLPGEGIIVRTAAAGQSEEALRHDLMFLRDLWRTVIARAETFKAPKRVYEDLDMLSRLIRDVFTDRVDKLIIDDRNQAAQVRELLQHTSPLLVSRVSEYNGREPLLGAWKVREQLDKAYRRKLWLKSGGYLVIDETEALTVIDVNTGKYTGSVDLDQTAYETNYEAAEEIARLLRLRDLAGMIVVDFIDMGPEAHRTAIAERMEACLKHDRTKSIVVGWTRLGLLEMTRKKVRENWSETMFETCPCCRGSGKKPMHGSPVQGL